MAKEHIASVVVPAVRKWGWMIQWVGPSTKEQVRFAYTIGMTDHGLPDIIVLGLPLRASAAVLNQVAELFLMLRKPYVGELHRVIRKFPVRLRRCSSTANFLGQALFSGDYNRHRNLRAKRGIQVVLPDAKGRFIGERGFVGNQTLRTLI